MALFWYNRVQRPSIRIESFNNPFFDRMSAYYQNIGRSLVVLDITSDLGIPAAAAVSWNYHGKQILIALGAHLEPRIAISRAISELNQMKPVADLWNESRDERSNPADDQHIADWALSATIENQPYLVPDQQHSRDAHDLLSMAETNCVKGRRESDGMDGPESASICARQGRV
jgi:oxazoline/thiazoline synthase